jgi:hypothetical protein
MIGGSRYLLLFVDSNDIHHFEAIPWQLCQRPIRLLIHGLLEKTTGRSIDRHNAHTSAIPHHQLSSVRHGPLMLSFFST